MIHIQEWWRRLRHYFIENERLRTEYTKAMFGKSDQIGGFWS